MHISSCLPLDTYMCLMGDIYRPNPEIRLPEFICSSPQLLFKVQPNSARVPIDDALLGGKMLCKHCIVVLLTHLQRHLHCGGHPPELPAPPRSMRRMARKDRRPPRGATGGAIIASCGDVLSGLFRGPITGLWPLTSLCHCILTPF